MKTEKNKVFFNKENDKIIFDKFWITDNNKHLFLVNFIKKKWDKLNNIAYDFAIVDLATANTYGVVLENNNIKTIDNLNIFSFDKAYYEVFNHDDIYYIDIENNIENEEHIETTAENESISKKRTPDEMRKILNTAPTLF